MINSASKNFLRHTQTLTHELMHSRTDARLENSYIEVGRAHLKRNETNESNKTDITNKTNKTNKQNE